MFSLLKKAISIHAVIKNGDISGAQALLDAGVDINARDQNGSTPLHWAARYGQKQVVELLINKGADVDAKDNSGSTPLDRAIQGNHADITDLLRQRVVILERFMLLQGMDILREFKPIWMQAVSYTHLTLPTNREV